MTQPDLVVSNASPLITLAKIGQFDLLQKLFGRIVIPQAVYDEVGLHSAGEPGALETRDADWVHVKPVADDLAVSFLQEELGAGESAAIVLAQMADATLLLLDDALARRKAERVGLTVIGTLGVLLMAKQAGLIEAVQPLLNALCTTDFRVSARVLDEVLARAGEM
jgi:predicted nucleic acid-binding protein